MKIPFEQYESRAPSAQNAIDAVPGWNSALPPEFGVTAGDKALYADGRIGWAIDRFGPIARANVLELGPLEGAHTLQLHGHGAQVTAIEANKGAFLRCLITKEIAGLDRARFLLGDAVQFLEQTDARYDLIVACGVLYHMPDPLRLLDAIAKRTDAVYLWTHFVDETKLSAGDPALKGWASTREITTFHGEPAILYRRSYLRAHENVDFCGGAFDEHRWMARSSILSALRSLGFTRLEIEHEDHANPHGSSFSLFARR